MRKNSVLLARSAIVLFILTGAVNAETLETSSVWNGSNYISSYGVPNTATYGQTFLPTATQTSLLDFTFYLSLASGTPTQNQAFVYQWDPSTSRIVGSALYQSPVLNAPSGVAYTPVTVTTGGVTLLAGTQYVVFFTTSTVTGQANGVYRWGSVATNTPYPGGQFVYQNNGTNFANLSAVSWSAIAQDLAFIFKFADPAAAIPVIPVIPIDISHSGELGTAAVTSGLASADLFLEQISDPFTTDLGVLVPNQVKPTAYYPAAASNSAATALAALAGNSQHKNDPHSAWLMWGAAYGGAQDIDGNAVDGTVDVHTANWGLTAGFTRALEEGKIGFALGGGGSTFSLGDNLGDGHSGVFNAGVYGTRTFGNAYLSGSGGYAFNNIDTSRVVGGDNLTADFNANTLFGRIEAGYRSETSVAIVTPYTALQGAAFFMPSYSEKASGLGTFAVDYDSQTETALRTELGARFDHVLPTESGNVRLTGRLAWAWNAETARTVTANFQNLALSSFNVQGAEPGRNALLVDAGAEFAVRPNMSVNLALNGEYSGDDIAYGASAKLKYRW